MRLGQGAEVGIEGGLIFFDREKIVGLFLLDQEARGLALGMQRIGGDHPSGQVQGCEQRFELRDLVGTRPGISRCATVTP